MESREHRERRGTGLASCPWAPRLLLIFTIASTGSFGRGTDAAFAQTGALDQPDVILSPVLDTVFRVGAGAAEEDQPVRVASVAFDASANLHVLDIGSYRLSVWNMRGELVRTVGGEGEGPAEFRRPKTAFVNRDGSVAVFDLAPGAYKVFDSEGEYLRSVKASGPMLGGQAVHTDDGRWVEPHEPWMTSGSGDEKERPLRMDGLPWSTRSGTGSGSCRRRGRSWAWWNHGELVTYTYRGRRQVTREERGP